MSKAISFNEFQRRKMRGVSLAVAMAVALGAMSVAAGATTITNKDDKEHTVTIIDGDKERQVVLKPEQKAENVCPTGCRLRLQDDDEDYELDAKDVVVIEEGYLYYDEPEQPQQSPAAPPAQAPAPAAPEKKG